MKVIRNLTLPFSHFSYCSISVFLFLRFTCYKFFQAYTSLIKQTVNPRMTLNKYFYNATSEDKIDELSGERHLSCLNKNSEPAKHLKILSPLLNSIPQ